MRSRHVIVLTAVMIGASACVTKSLWKATDPDEYVAVPQSAVSEAELRERGAKFRTDDRNGVYYVEKSSLRRLGDYTIRFFAAPVTVVLDAAPAILVVGGVTSLSSLAEKSGGQPYDPAFKRYIVDPTPTPAVLYPADR